MSVVSLEYDNYSICIRDDVFQRLVPVSTTCRNLNGETKKVYRAGDILFENANELEKILFLAA